MPQIVCPACGATVAAADDACGNCGTGLANNAPPGKKSFVDARWFIISMMVFAALFLGFPLLWRSKAFSRGEKVFWTLVVTVETIVVFAAFGWVMWHTWGTIQQAM